MFSYGRIRGKTHMTNILWYKDKVFSVQYVYVTDLISLLFRAGVNIMTPERSSIGHAITVVSMTPSLTGLVGGIRQQGDGKNEFTLNSGESWLICTSQSVSTGSPESQARLLQEWPTWSHLLDSEHGSEIQEKWRERKEMEEEERKKKKREEY